MTLEETIEAAVRRVMRESFDELAARLKHLAIPDEMLTLEQAGEIAKVSPETVRDWIKQKLLRRYGAGRAIRVRRDELLNVRPKVEPFDVEQRALEIIRAGRR